MKNITTLLTLFFLPIFLWAGTSISVMSYNIRLDAKSDGADNWHQRKADMVDYLYKMSPDFIGVQEALFHQLSYLDENLKDYQYIGVGRDDGKEAGEFMAIFYKKDTWTVQKEATFWLSETPTEPTMGWDAACFRVCTYGVFKNKKGKTIALFNTHFDHLGKMARKNSVAVIHEYIASYLGKHPTVLMGDFNVEPSDEVYQLLTATLVDAYPSGKKNQGTFNAFQLNENFDKRIDYIFVEKGNLKVRKFKIERPLTTSGRQLSDHFPVWACLKI